MATLERIRNRMGLLISVVIGMALLAFILGDLFRGGTSLSSDQFEVAEINGTPVDYRNYDKRVETAMENAKRNSNTNTLDDQTINTVRDQVWQQLLQEHILGEEIELAGVSVSVAELKDMVAGNNIHPQIRQAAAFQDPETGQFDPQRVLQYIASLDQMSEQDRQNWYSYEQYLKQDRINKKYYAAIQKGMYVTDFEAKQAAIAKQKKVDFKYISMPYTELSDEEIQISDADLSKYYEENKNLFKQERAVDIEYVVFSVEPTQKDIEDIKLEVESLKKELKETNEEAQFVTATSDTPFDGKFYQKGEYENPLIDSVMFASEEGAVYGPYQYLNSWRIAKVAHVEERPDTIKLRHIVLAPSAQQSAQQTKDLADSLTQIIENGADFEALAKKYSIDEETAENGGDMGWRNVEEMVYGEDLLDAGVGGVVNYPTNQVIFIAEMTEMGKKAKQVQLAVIARDIVPSEETRDEVYNKANVFAGKHRTVKLFNEGIANEALIKKQANNLKTTSRQITGLTNPRNLIREAFSTEENQIVVGRNSQSPIFEMGDDYVIGVVTKKYAEGFAPLAEVKNTVEKAVKKEKKAEMLVKKMTDAIASAQNIEAVAESLSAEIKTSTNVTFAAFSIPGIGIEPNVQGTAIALNKDEMSAPIEGANAVYLIQVTEVKEPGEKLNIDMEKKSIQRQYISRVQSQAFEALKESSDIVDNRINFY
jgi:peptidyl-prolyl cis-trans isomerase D